MRIKIQGFFYQAHSWSIVNQNIGRALIKLGHDIDFVPTDAHLGNYCPEDLRPFVKEAPEGEYDCQISYTAPHNWPEYLKYGKPGSPTFGIWAFEYPGKGILPGFARYHHACTKVLPPSNFTKEVFIDMGIPENKMVVVPHGINLEDYKSKEKIQLRTKKKRKILINLAQPHLRKNIPAALKIFGKAFNKNDDVCLVAKVLIQNKKNQQFDVDFYKLYKTFEQKFPKHAEVEIITKFVPNIVEMYNACDINFSATHSECFHLPSLEALSCNHIINTVPRYGGILDFCNDDNSLLIDGAVKRCPREHVYWTQNPFAVHFEVDVDDGVKKLQYAVEHYNELIEKFSPHMRSTAEKYTWENVALQILELMKGTK